MCDGDGICGMIRGSLENDAQNAIIVGEGVVESLQDYRSNTVTSAICSNMLGICVETFRTQSMLTAICIVIKSLAVACLRQELSTTETSKNVGVRHHVEAASDRSIAIACP